MLYNDLRVYLSIYKLPPQAKINQYLRCRFLFLFFFNCLKKKLYNKTLFLLIPHNEYYLYILVYLLCWDIITTIQPYHFLPRLLSSRKQITIITVIQKLLDHPVAQLVDHQITNQKVVGSIPNLDSHILCFEKCSLPLFQVETFLLARKRLVLVITPWEHHRNIVRIPCRHHVIEMLLKRSSLHQDFVYLQGGENNNVQEHINKLFKALQNFYHPSNLGKWIVCIVGL